MEKIRWEEYPLALRMYLPASSHIINKRPDGNSVSKLKNGIEENSMESKNISPAVIKRLPRYYRYLGEVRDRQDFFKRLK